MNISWYKNFWYYGAILTVVFIFILAFGTASRYQVAIVTPDGNFSLPLEVIYRFIFNPLWAIVLYFVDKAKSLNAEHHRTILENIKGLVSGTMDAGEECLSTRTVASLIFKNKDIEKVIVAKLAATDSVAPTPGDPVV